MKQLIPLVACCVLLAQAQEATRIDLYDKHSNRVGYAIIDERTGRIDQFDTRGNRLGYGVTTTTPSGARVDTFAPNGARTGGGTLPTTPRR